MKHEPVKSDGYQRLAETAKALTNGRRLEILELLAQRERSVEALAHLSGSAMSTTSSNLQILRRAGMVRTRREATTIYYSLSGDDVANLVSVLKEVAIRHSPALHEFRRNRADAGAVLSGRQVHAERADEDAFFVLDVRPVEEYDAGHFPGAVSIPLAELPDRVGEVPADRAVTVYCRGEFCMLARQAADFLRERGIDAAAIDEGVLEWRGEQTMVLDVSA